MSERSQTSVDFVPDVLSFLLWGGERDLRDRVPPHLDDPRTIKVDHHPSRRPTLEDDLLLFTLDPGRIICQTGKETSHRHDTTPRRGHESVEPERSRNSVIVVSDVLSFIRSGWKGDSQSKVPQHIDDGRVLVTDTHRPQGPATQKRTFKGTFISDEQ